MQQLTCLLVKRMHQIRMIVAQCIDGNTRRQKGAGAAGGKFITDRK